MKSRRIFQMRNISIKSDLDTMEVVTATVEKHKKEVWNVFMKINCGFTAATYLINNALPASVLTGSTSFQDSLKMFLVSRDKEMETVLNPNAAGRADKLKMAPRW